MPCNRWLCLLIELSSFKLFVHINFLLICSQLQGSILLKLMFFSFQNSIKIEAYNQIQLIH